MHACAHVAPARCRRRFDLMAGFRNKLLDVIVGDPELQSWDTVIMVDMDLFGKAWLPGGYPEWESNSQGCAPRRALEQPRRFRKASCISTQTFRCLEVCVGNAHAL